MDQDEGAYDNLARNIAKGRGYVLDFWWILNTPGQPTMYGGAGYPLFVGAIYAIFGNGWQLPVFLIQILLHGMAGALLVSLATRLAGGLAGFVAGSFFAFHPPLIWLAVAMMSENAMIPLVPAVLWLLLVAPRRWGGCRWLRPAVLGLVLGFLAETRSTFAGYVAVAALWLVWQARRRQPRWQALVPAAVTGLVFVLICTPWAYRNYVIWGRFIPFSTKSGVNAYFFNHDGMKVEFGRAAVDGQPPVSILGPEIQGKPDEPSRNDAAKEYFRAFVREKPGKFIGLTWMRFWLAMLPVRITSESLTATLAAWYSKGTALTAWLSLLGLGMLGRLKWRRLLLRLAPLLMMLAMWQAIQSLAGPGMRYRMPVESAYAVLIGVMMAVVGAWLAPRVFGHRLAARWLKRKASI